MFSHNIYYIKGFSCNKGIDCTLYFKVAMDIIKLEGGNIYIYMNLLMRGVQVTVIGMGVVFLVLLVLSLILELFKFLFYKEEKLKGKENININKKASVFKKSQEQEIVVISAVMATLLNDDECIVNIKRVK